MNTNISMPMRIELQGDEVLILLNYVGNRVHYKVIGFLETEIYIQDNRHNCVDAILEYIASGEIVAFLDYFTAPSHVSIVCEDSARIIIKLGNTHQTNIDHILWIGIGLDNYLPNYDYRFLICEPMEQDHSAIVSVFNEVNSPSASSATMSVITESVAECT